MTHQGYENDLEIASALNGVDIIIGGDSHTLMGDFSDIGLNRITKKYPAKAKI